MRAVQSFFRINLVIVILIFAIDGKQVLASFCDNSLLLKPTLDGLTINNFAEFLEDKDNTLSINEILSKKLNFQSLKNKHTNFGATRSVYWVRFNVCNLENESIEWFVEIMNPFIYYLNFFIVKNNNIQYEKSITLEDDFYSRDIHNRRYLFPINNSSGQNIQIYVRMKGMGLSLVDLSMRLWTPAQFYHKTKTENIIIGMFYGGMIMMVLYNLFIYLTIKDKTYLYYVLYLPFICLVFFSVSGHGFEYVWPESIFLKLYAAKLFVALAVIFGIQFSRHLLGTNQVGGVNDKILVACWFYGVILLISILFNFVDLQNYLVWNCSFIPLIAIIVGYRVYRTGNKHARFYIVAWFLLYLGSAIFGLLSLGIVQYSLITELAPLVGVFLEGAFLSFALADRIRLLRKEKEEARLKLIQANIDKEQVQYKLVQAQIEPHFFFNTLAHISCLIETNVQKAQTMLSCLDTYFRIILARTRKGDVSLKQEIDLLKAYLKIIQIRMGKRLQFKIDIPEHLYDVPLPPLLLQPLVENSIKHGLEPKIEGGNIYISGKKYLNNLFLEVSDNGIGLSDHWMAGVGVSNVHERIRSLYRGEGKLVINENADGGVSSYIQIPVKTECNIEIVEKIT